MLAKLFLYATVAAVAAAAATRALVGLPDHNTAQCDSQGLVFLLLPHYTDCSKYYMCSHGQEIEFSCPFGTLFDYSLQGCNWESATDCWLRTTEESEIEEGGSGDGAIDAGSSEGSGDWLLPGADVHAALNSGAHASSDQVVGQLNCAVAQLSSRLAPYRGDCQRYWRCSGGAAESVFCSDGLYFNTRSLQCDFEANVPCERDALAVDEIGAEFLPY